MSINQAKNLPWSVDLASIKDYILREKYSQSADNCKDLHAEQERIKALIETKFQKSVKIMWRSKTEKELQQFQEL